MSKVTSRTLRHYDAIGLLRPAHVGSNGYRFYEQEQLLRLQQILLLRELGLGLGATKPFPSNSDAALRTGLAMSRLSVHSIWLAYAALGGSRPYDSVHDAFTGTLRLEAEDHDLQATVLNHGVGGVVRYAHELDHGAHHPSRQPPA